MKIGKKRKFGLKAKTGTGSGNVTIQKVRNIGRNDHTKYHWDGFNSYKDINCFIGKVGKIRKFQLKPEPDPEMSEYKMSVTLAGMFTQNIIGMVPTVTKI